MDVAKADALGQGPFREAAPAQGETGKRFGTADPRAAAATATVDEALIKALDESTALQILIAEVRQSVLGDPLAGASSNLPAMPTLPPGSSQPATPATAAGWLLASFLAAVPTDESDARVWIDRVLRLEQAFRTGYESAAAIVSAWRDVTPEIVASVHDAQALFATATAAERDAGFARAEWLILEPRLERFRRRRRTARRRLEDPDHPASAGGAWPGFDADRTD